MTRPQRTPGTSPRHRAPRTRYASALLACLALALLGSLAVGPSAAAADLSPTAAVALVGVPMVDPPGDDNRCHPWEDWCRDDDKKCRPWWKCDNNDDKKCRPWWKCDKDRSTAPRSRAALSR